MIDINTSSDFPASFLAAREKSNAAADAERAAWEAMQTGTGSGTGTGTGGVEAQAWRKAQEAARQAQDEFEREVRDWFAQNALD